MSIIKCSTENKFRFKSEIIKQGVFRSRNVKSKETSPFYKIPPHVSHTCNFWYNIDPRAIIFPSKRVLIEGLTVIPFLSMRERMERRGNYSRHSLLSPQDSANKRPQIIAMRKKTDESVSSNAVSFVCVVVFRNS